MPIIWHAYTSPRKLRAQVARRMKPSPRQLRLALLNARKK